KPAHLPNPISLRTYPAHPGLRKPNCRTVSDDTVRDQLVYPGIFRQIASALLSHLHLVKNAIPCARLPKFEDSVKMSLLLLVFLQPFAHGSTQKDGADPSAASYRLRFGDQLGLSQDLVLCGSSDHRTLRFYSESRWKPVTGTRLHLFLDHSANLDGDRSFLSVGLNYGILRSLRLDSQNEPRSEVMIPLPPELLKRENEFVFSVTQFPCSSANGTPCTSIKLDSYIEVPNSEGESTLDLSLFPIPFVDPHSYRPQKVSLVVPNSTVSTTTLQAIALMAASLARQAGSQQLQVTFVRTLDSADTPLILIGTPQEQPELRRVVAQSHLVIERGEQRVSAGSGDSELL